MNTETQLYLALHVLYNAADHAFDQRVPFDVVNSVEGRASIAALEQFEMGLGPLPDWAIAHNISDDLVPGLQLLTKDGRNCGNAHIVSSYVSDKTYYCLLTDAGSKMTFGAAEIHEWFYLGKFISEPDAVVARFGSRGMPE